MEYEQLAIALATLSLWENAFGTAEKVRRSSGVQFDFQQTFDDNLTRAEPTIFH